MQFFIQSLPGSGVSMKMVKVEGGVFDMGGESWRKDALPVHRVVLSDYWMAVHPVTQQLWETILGKEKNESWFRGKDRPVEVVSWEQINDEFLPVFNQVTIGSRPAGTFYQLPTEAQWEYAARGGNQGKGFIYSGGNNLDDVGWYEENSHGETKPVGLKLSNELGLHDMSGNVWEWCYDWYGGDYYQKCRQKGVVKDPFGPAGGDDRVLRGGCWFSYPRYCRVSDRYYDHPARRFNFIGFRLVLGSLPVL